MGKSVPGRAFDHAPNTGSSHWAQDVGSAPQVAGTGEPGFWGAMCVSVHVCLCVCGVCKHRCETACLLQISPSTWVLTFSGCCLALSEACL